MLTSCETIRAAVPSSRIPVADEQFNCGPTVEAIPEQGIIAEWTSEQLLDYAVDSWLWGERCAVANELNRHYFQCTIEKKKDACDRFNALLERIRNREVPDANS